MPIYLIVNPAIFPTHLLAYVDPTDHYSYTGIPISDSETRPYESLEEITNHVSERRAALRYPEIPFLAETIQHYLYLIAEAPSSHFFAVHDHNLPATYPRTFTKDVATGAKLAFSLSRQALTGLFKAGSSGWVTKREATNRAEACYNCPNNRETTKSILVRANNKLAALFTPLKSTPFDSGLRDCGVCGCPNVEKVHYSPAVVIETTPAKIPYTDFPEVFLGKDNKRHRCWVREILEQRPSVHGKPIQASNRSRRRS